MECAECGRVLERSAVGLAGTVEFLPCLHPVHDACLKDLLKKADVNRRCPDTACARPVPTDFRRLAEPRLQELVGSYESCRAALRAFFLDFLASRVFAADEPPPTSLVTHLLHLTYPETDHHTQRLTPLPRLDVVDPSPVVRAFLLQQLLRYESTFHLPTFEPRPPPVTSRTRDVKQQIRIYCEGSLRKLHSPADKSRFIAMCIQCVEVHSLTLLFERFEGDG